MHSDILLILAQYLAIYNTAKRYHWQVKWAGFMGDHLQFDKVADIYDTELVDSIIEQYYMGISRDKIHETDLIVKLSTKLEGAVLHCESEKDATVMMDVLRSLVSTLISAINEVKISNRGVNSELDNICAKANQALGLLNGRSNDVLSRLKRC